MALPAGGRDGRQHELARGAGGPRWVLDCGIHRDPGDLDLDLAQGQGQPGEVRDRGRNRVEIVGVDAERPTLEARESSPKIRLRRRCRRSRLLNSIHCRRRTRWLFQKAQHQRCDDDSDRAALLPPGVSSARRSMRRGLGPAGLGLPVREDQGETVITASRIDVDRQRVGAEGQRRCSDGCGERVGTRFRRPRADRRRAGDRTGLLERRRLGGGVDTPF